LTWAVLYLPITHTSASFGALFDVETLNSSSWRQFVWWRSFYSVWKR